jgi:hypothetical protein
MEKFLIYNVMKIKKYKELDKEFVKLDVLDKILNIVKEYLPDDLKYIRIFNETVGHEQRSLDLKYLDNNFKECKGGETFGKDNYTSLYCFTPREQEKFGEHCVEDFISNNLSGYIDELKDLEYTNGITFDDLDEFYDKIENDKVYYYEYG